MRKSNQGCANGRKKGRKEPAPLTFSFFSPLPGPSSAIIKRRRSNSKRNNACESAPHFSQDANRACVPRVFLSFPLEHKLWIMFFFKLRLIIAEIEEIGGLMSLWELTFFVFFLANEIILKLLRYWWNYEERYRLENYEFRVIYVEIDYVDQVFLCFLVSLIFVIIGDKEN